MGSRSFERQTIHLPLSFYTQKTNPMKNPFPLRLLCRCFPVFLHLSSQAQSRFGIDLGGGLVIPASAQINKVFYTGGEMSLGFRVAPLPGKRLWIVPGGGFKMYMKGVGSDNSLTETFLTGKAGLEFQYQAAERRKWTFFPLVRIDYNWCSNSFSKTYGYDPTTNTTTIAETNSYLSGHDLSYDAGIMIVRSSLWFLKIDYEYFNPSLKVNNDLKNQLMADGFAVPATTRINCSSVNIGLGLTVNFKHHSRS
jgi:hypothetical protein